MMPARRVARRTSRRTSRRMADQQAPQQAAPPPPAPAASPPDDMAQIQQLATMKDQGLLTEEEFQAKKKQILGI